MQLGPAKHCLDGGGGGGGDWVDDATIKLQWSIKNNNNNHCSNHSKDAYPLCRVVTTKLV